MTGFVMMPRVFPPRGGELYDTFISCGDTASVYKYAHGGSRPHYPMPALPLRAFIWHDAVDFFNGSGYVGSILKEEHHD